VARIQIQIKISASSLPTGQLGTAYSTSLTATGGVSPYTWSLTRGSPPAGLILNASPGTIATPSASVASTPLTFQSRGLEQPCSYANSESSADDFSNSHGSFCGVESSQGAGGTEIMFVPRLLKTLS